jgi:hypothetical protein
VIGCFVNLSGRSLAQEFSKRLGTAAAGVRFQVSSCGIRQQTGPGTSSSLGGGRKEWSGTESTLTEATTDQLCQPRMMIDDDDGDDDD